MKIVNYPEETDEETGFCCGRGEFHSESLIYRLGPLEDRIGGGDSNLLTGYLLKVLLNQRSGSVAIQYLSE